MMIHEFIERTKYTPSDEEYHYIYVVYLVEECTGNEYEKYECNSYFDAEVYIDHHKYSCPKGCFYKIYAVGR